MLSQFKKLGKDWKQLLTSELEKPYYNNMSDFLEQEFQNGKVIFPPCDLIFNAFMQTSVDNVKVIILGQDPYHKKNQGMGLSFSVPKGIRVPPSLKNIYKELERDVKFVTPNHGDLTHWAIQGVFLLNAMLTVEASVPGSHRNIGWQSFTDAVITNLSLHKENLVFMLWGNFAKSKRELIDSGKHLILEAAHPSPLARNAFSGSAHFSQANKYLMTKGQTPINWQLPESENNQLSIF